MKIKIYKAMWGNDNSMKKVYQILLNKSYHSLVYNIVLTDKKVQLFRQLNTVAVENISPMLKGKTRKDVRVHTQDQLISDPIEVCIPLGLLLSAADRVIYSKLKVKRKNLRPVPWALLLLRYRRGRRLAPGCTISTAPLTTVQVNNQTLSPLALKKWGKSELGLVCVFVAHSMGGGEDLAPETFVPFRVPQSPYFQLVGKTKVF